MSIRKTTFAPVQLLRSVHMKKSYLGKAGYPVLQASDHAPRQSWARGQWVAPGQWVVPGSCEQAPNVVQTENMKSAWENYANVNFLFWNF